MKTLEEVELLKSEATEKDILIEILKALIEIHEKLDNIEENTEK